MPELKNVRYSDTFLHEIIEENGVKKKRGLLFPITRYDNVMNRPIVASNIRSSKNPDFLLVPVSTVEIDDEEIFNMYGQEW